MVINISENIALLRKKKGISQEELAKIFGVSNQAVSKWEAGKCCPDIALIPDLAFFFGVTVDELLCGKKSSITRYLIGIDGGGSHTEGILCSADGKVCKSLRVGPSSVGTDRKESEKNIVSLISLLIEELGDNDTVECLCAGISGCGNVQNRMHYYKLLEKNFPNIKKIEVENDIGLLAYSLGVRKNVVITICGTGCVAVALADDGVSRVDGYGHLIGDDGGGYSIGRDTLRAILRQSDGRGGETLLTKLFFERDGKSALESLPEINREGKQRIASYAPLAFEAAKAGDKIATDILEKAVFALCNTVRAASRHISVSPVPIIMGGSIWIAGGGYVKDRVQEILSDGYEWLLPDKSGAYGAVIHAAELSDISDFKIE